MTTPIRQFIILLFLCATASSVTAHTEMRTIRVAVLDLGSTRTAELASETITRVFASSNELSLIDRTQSGPAVRGVGYAGSLNMTLEDARNLGAVIDCDFYFIGDVQTLRRSSSSRPVYYESYASVFIVSARSGRLVKWERPSFEAPSAVESEKMLLAELTVRASGYLEVIQTAERSERNERELSVIAHAPLIEDVPEEASPQAKGLRLPQPYRRIRPVYPDSAAKAEAIATVDILVDLDQEGEVEKVEVVRWAGFGLDDETVNTVRRMHFRPAIRDGVPIPMRVLLRYNFRPTKQNTDEKNKGTDNKPT